MTEITRVEALEYALRNVLEKIPPMVLGPFPVFHVELSGAVHTDPGQTVEYPAFRSAVDYARGVLELHNQRSSENGRSEQGNAEWDVPKLLIMFR